MYRDEISAVASVTRATQTLPTGPTSGSSAVTSVNRRIDKKGRPFGFAQVEDYAGVVECVFFSDVFEGEGFLEPDRVVLVQGGSIVVSRRGNRKSWPTRLSTLRPAGGSLPIPCTCGFRFPAWKRGGLP
jgi:DNA polymerase III alpha subunit